MELLELRRLLTAAQDITSLTALRNDPSFAGINGSGIGVAVLDSGTWANHPDLRNNFAAFFDAVKNPASSAGSTKVTDAFDPDGHGTHTAGTAVSSNPNIGVATGAKLIAVRALPAANEAQPSFDTVANGLQWVLNNSARFNIKVVNMSLGVPGVNDNTGKLTDQESAIIKRLENIGVTVVSAAGNDYADFAPAPGASTPAAYSTLVVSNTWADKGRSGEFPLISGSGGYVRYFAQENDAAPDRFAATSQRSTLPGEIAAPGSDILSTWNDPNKLYQYDSGTSMASPFIAGTVALMQQTSYMLGGRYLTPEQVRTVLITSADTITDSNVTTNSRIPVSFDSSGNPVRSGTNQPLPETGLQFKRVNVYAAVKAVKALVTTGSSTPPPVDTPPPSGTDPDATQATATTVPDLDGNANYSFTGNVGKDGSVNVGAGDVDVYKLTVLSPGVVTADVTLPGGGTAFDAAVRLFDSAGNQLSVTEGTASSYPALVSARLSPGTYYVGISATGNESYTIVQRGGAVNGDTTGDYSVTFSLANPDPNGVPQGSVAVDLTSPDNTDPRSGARAVYFLGSIGSDPNPLDNTLPRVQIGPADVDMFRVTAPDDGTLTIDTRGSGTYSDGVDTFVRVFDSNYNAVTIDQQFVGSGFGDAVASLHVTRGTTYYIGISSYGNRAYNATSSFDRSSSTGQTGGYDLYLSMDNGDVDGNAYDAQALAVGSSFAAAIGVDGSSVIPGAFGENKDVDFYRYTVQATGLLDLSANPGSTDFHPVLALWRLSADNSSITRDADTTGRSPRIIAPVTASETVYVSVTGQGNDDFKWFSVASGSGGETGTYTLASNMRPSTDSRALTNSSIRYGTPTEVFSDTPVYANLGTTNSVETGPASVNIYRYVATYTGSVRIRASVPGDQPTDPYLRLFDSTGKELAYNDDADPTTRDALVTYDVVAGRTYYIGVNPSSGQARAYDPITGDNAAPGTEGDYVLLVSTQPRISVGGSTVSGSTEASSVTFTVSLSSPASQDVTADFATYDPGGYAGATAGTDYTPVSQTVTIPAGQTSVTVTVPMNADATPGRARVVGASLANVVGARKGLLTASATVLPAVAATASTSAPDLVAESLTLLPNGPVVPGDRIPATLVLRAAGTANVVGRFSLRTVISADQYATNADLRVATDRTLSLRLKPDATYTLRLSVLVPAALEAGAYYFLSALTPIGSRTTDAVRYNDQAASNVTTVEWRFGTFAGHRGKVLSLPGADGKNITFSIAGPGEGTISRDSVNLLSASVSGTTTVSSLVIRPVGSLNAAIFSLSVGSPLKALLAGNVSVLGDLTLPTPAPKTVRLFNK
jgi:hypothetical protein